MSIIKIKNKVVERFFKYDLKTKKFFTSHLINKKTGKNLVVGESSEFAIKIADKDNNEIDIRNFYEQKNGKLEYKTHTIENLKDGKQKLTILLKSLQAPILIHLFYEIHPEYDWIRKWIRVENTGDTPLMIKQYDTEMLSIPKNTTAHYFASWRWGGDVPEKYKKVGVGIHSEKISNEIIEPCSVPRESPLIISNEADTEGIWIFPEIPIKTVSVIEDNNKVNLCVSNPCAKQILPGETYDFNSGVVIGVYRGRYQTGFERFRNYLQDFVIKEDRAKKSLLVFNTWYSQGFEVNEATCKKEIDICAELGVELFVLDAGWHSNLGDWEVDRKKFPNSLEKLSSYCHKKKLKFGLWVDARLASKDSKIFKLHPEWCYKDKNGLPYSQPEDIWFGHPLVCMCLGSDYGDYLKERFVKLVKEYDLDCIKIDNCCNLASFWDECYDKNHHHLTHIAHNEIWDKWAEILSSIKNTNPKIIIENIACGLSLFDKYDIDWTSDFMYPFRSGGVIPNPDWLKETHYMRTLNYFMAYTHPVSTIHQAWVDASSPCLDLMCASLLGGNLWTGITGLIENVTDEQKKIIKKWIDWRKKNKKYLSVYQHLFEDKPPVIPLRGKQDHIDGFAHLLKDGGWIFLFNPTDKDKEITFEIDLSKYGTDRFSDITNVVSYKYNFKTNKLRITQNILTFSYSESYISCRKNKRR